MGTLKTHATLVSNALPSDQYDQFINNVWQYNIRRCGDETKGIARATRFLAARDHEKASNVIAAAFDWNEVPEGFRFWLHIAVELSRKGL